MEQNITALYLSRDEQAIKETDAEYGRLVRMICQNILGSAQDTEECVNDTYLQLWNTIPPNKPESLKAYICIIARNLSLNRLRFLNAEKRCPGQIDAVLDELSEVIPSKENVEERVESALLSEQLSEFLRAQSEENRVIFIKRYWLIMPVKDIARDLNMSQTKVASSLHRTRIKLRRYLTEKGYEI